MPSVHFFYEGVNFRLLSPRTTASWLKRAILSEKKQLTELNYIFCSDEHLAGLNLKYLNHTTFTDIITFDMSDVKNFIEGEIYISVDRVKENSALFKTEFRKELHRVMIHGALHLLGFSDKTKSEKILMRNKEEAYLSLLPNSST